MRPIKYVQEIPYVENPNANIISFAKSYNIPALAHPKKLIDNAEPWKNAELKDFNDKTKIVNNSSYLIKMLPTYDCLGVDGLTIENLTSPYLLPNKEFILNKKCSVVTISPVSNEGQILPKYKITQ